MRKKTRTTTESSSKIGHCVFPGCPIYFNAKRSTRKYCGGAHAKAARRKIANENAVRDGACKGCGKTWDLKVRDKRLICGDCLQFEKDCRRHDHRFPFKFLRDPFSRLRTMPRDRWPNFIENHSDVFPKRSDQERDTVTSALLLLSPWSLRREYPTIELEGRYYPDMCSFDAIEWTIRARSEDSDPFEILYGDDSAAA